MKGRESGMPDGSLWTTFFDPSCMVAKLDCAESKLGLVEFGCGYGTFTVPAARVAKGTVYALDIDPDMVTATSQRVREAQLANVVVRLRDFVADGSGLPDASTDHAMLYNILHIENPVELLGEAFRILAPGGKVSIINWRSDIETPRGPSLPIRPSPKDCRRWGEQAGFKLARFQDFTCCSYHFGLVLERPNADTFAAN